MLILFQFEIMHRFLKVVRVAICYTCHDFMDDAVYLVEVSGQCSFYFARSSSSGSSQARHRSRGAPFEFPGDLFMLEGKPVSISFSFSAGFTLGIHELLVTDHVPISLQSESEVIEVHVT